MDVGYFVSRVDREQDQNPIAEGDDDQLGQNQPVQHFQLASSKPKDQGDANRHDGACQKAQKPNDAALESQFNPAAGPANVVIFAGDSGSHHAIQETEKVTQNENGDNGPQPV